VDRVTEASIVVPRPQVSQDEGLHRWADEGLQLLDLPAFHRPDSRMHTMRGRRLRTGRGLLQLSEGLSLAANPEGSCAASRWQR
jgi:hypothetical protein